MRFISSVWRAAAVGLLGASVLGGCASETKEEKPAAAAAPASTAKVATINTMCPIGGHDFAAGSRTAKNSRTWKGKTIGFCCGDCVETFEGMSDAEKDKILKLAEANQSQ